MNKKEYTIQINGLTSSVKDVTSLEKALQSLDKTAKNTTASPKGTSSGTSKAKAMTDEEKAAKRLAETQKRLTEVNNEANRAQIEATQQLREKQREVSREIALNQLAEGSIASMGMQLTNLRNEYERLSEEERNNIDIGGQMLTKIQALDEEYKELRESTGNFRDSVGNYEKALSGLNKLDKGLGDVGNNINSLSAGFSNNSALMGIFGSVTENTEKAQVQLAKIIALVTLAQQLSTSATKGGIIATTLKTAIDKTATIQLKAKTVAENLATKGTVAATIAQKAFNLVASANPYVLLALALVGVIGALATFSDNTEEAAEAQKELNDRQKEFMSYQDEEAEKIKFNSKLRLDALTRQLELAKAQGKDLKSIQKIERELQNERILAQYALKGNFDATAEGIAKERAEVQRLEETLEKAKKSGSSKIKIQIDPNKGEVKMKTEDAIKVAEEALNNARQRLIIKITTQNDLLNEENTEKIIKEQHKKELQEEAKQASEKAKQAREEAKRKAEEARKNAQERAALELEAQRAVEDLRIKLMGQSLEAQKKLIQIEYDRQIQDLRIRLNKEENLSVKARQAINDQIVKLEQIKKVELEKLQDEILENEKETTRQLEDQKTALIKSAEDRRRAEIAHTYDRQIEDVQKRLDKEKTLTDNQKSALNQLIEGYEKQKQQELDNLTTEGLNRRAALEVQTAEDTLKAVQDKIGEVVKRNEEGVFKGVIDPKATKANLDETNNALSNYVTGLTEYQKDLKTAHEATIAGLKVGSIEYDEEMQKYAATNKEVTKKIKDAQKQQTENTKTSSQLMAEYYSEMFAKIAEYADLGAQAVSSVMDTLNMGIQASIDSLNDQLDQVNEKYEKAKEQRDKAADEVKATEEKIQNATGGTADALRDQLQNQMHARDEAAREEQRIAKEKEKLEAEIAKKEKQMRRNDLMSKIAMSIANTAQGISAAVAASPLTFGLPWSAFVGITGAIQTGIMTRQLLKLAKGGPIVGPSHDNGGVNIIIDGKPSYEAQGGEFMVNDVSYTNNKALTEFLNASPETLNAADLVGIVPGFEALPVAVNDISSNSDDRIVEAINGMEFSPVVSVTDIINVTDEVTTVRDLAGV